MNPFDASTPPANDSYREPIPVCAPMLAETEASLHNRLGRLQPVKYGCTDLDSTILFGGLQRGSIVGISADDADGFGLLMGLQSMIRAILEGSVNCALVITPKPLASISKLIVEISKSELSKHRLNPVQTQEKCRAVLDSVLLSVVFDIDGIRQTLYEFPQPLTALASPSTTLERPEGMPIPISESEGEDTSQSVGQVHATPCQQSSASAHEAHNSRSSARCIPEVIVVTHFSALLSSLFASREKTEAHRSLAVLRGQLRRLAHSSITSPLLLLVNSTTEETSSRYKESTLDLSSLISNHRSPEHMPHSIFASVRTLRPSRPSFGLVFNQFLDLHLLCTDLEKNQTSKTFLPEKSFISTKKGRQGHSPTLVEVLQDDLGLQTAHFHRHHEQRWAVFKVSNLQIVNGCET